MPLQIPGKSIRPRDSSVGFRCSRCEKKFVFPKTKVNPRTKKVVLVCPYCERPL